MSGSDDDLIMRYLARLRAAASGLLADRRHELIDEITAHIEEAMAAQPALPGGAAAVLDQLGSPEDIVRAAEAGSPGVLPYGPGRSPLGALEIAAILGLLIGGIILPVVGWVVGVVLLWVSPRWRTGDKLLATLVWPGGLLAPVVVFLVLGAGAMVTVGTVCSAGSSSSSSGQVTSTATHCTPPLIPPWLAITLAAVVMLAAIAGPILVAIRLIRRPLMHHEPTDQDLLAAPLPA